MVQLHGSETPFFASKIAVPVIKVIHMPTRSNTQIQPDLSEVIKSIDLFSGKASLILFDSKIPGSKGGGTGLTFDWEVVNKLNNIPVLLAGGLTVENVHEAIKENETVIGVDVSSGIELSGQPGVKDIPKMKLFIERSKL